MYQKRRIFFAVFLSLLAGIVLIAQAVSVDAAGRITGVTNPQAATDAATKAYVDAQINAVWPVGVVYIQYPDQNAPGVLWPNTTWTEISSSYAGAFFRADDGAGGAALNFNGGRQDDTFQNHTHAVNDPGHSHTLDMQILPNTNTSGSGRNIVDWATADQNFGLPKAYIRGAVTGITVGNANSGNAGGETRPENYTVKVWKRTN